MTSGALAWAAYEGARNPYVMVCSIYIFAPYVATVVIGDSARGLALIANMNTWAGFAVALMAPIVGAIADRAGRRKIPLAIVTAAMVCLIAALWFVTPGSPTALWFTLMFSIALLFNLSEALHNALLPNAAPASQVATASGLGLALGNLASVLILLFALFFLALPAEPLFGLDKAAHEPERAVGPIVAAWFAIFSLPVFLFTPDTPKGAPWIAAAKAGVASVRGALQRLRGLPQIARFLIARMFYADAKTAIIVLGGVYAAGVMGWGLSEMAVYGVYLSVLAVAGGLVGGWLDQTVGPKRAIQIEIVMVALSQALILSIDRDTILFAIPAPPDPVWDAPMFRTSAEIAFLLAVAPAPIFITAAYASSRTMLAKLAPPSMTGELFGLYALSGSATMWLGPLLVSSITGLTGRSELGLAALVGLLAIGFAILLPLKPPPK